MRAPGATLACSVYQSVWFTRVIVPAVTSKVPSACSPHPVTSDTMRGAGPPVRLARNVTAASPPDAGPPTSGVVFRPASISAIAASSAVVSGAGSRRRCAPGERQAYTPSARTPAPARIKRGVRRCMTLHDRILKTSKRQAQP